MSDKAASKRPDDTAFKQQRLKAWKPVLTPRTVLPWVLIIGVIFLAVGIALFVGSDNVKERVIDYTDCQNTNVQNMGMSCGNLLDNFSNGYTNLSQPNTRCACDIEVTLSNNFNDKEVFVYYGLDNFYQNHRAYVSSRWDAQLRAVTTTPGSDCSPLDRDSNGTAYAPCGLIANSLFNDTIELFKCPDDACTAPVKVTLDGSDISWKSDRKVKFKNPTPANPSDPLCTAPGFVDGAKLPNWPVPACELGTAVSTYHAHSPTFGSNGVGYENEDLIVWMRTAALPNFRKLYRRVDGSLPNGKYMVRIGYNYPVKSFDGAKRVILSTISWQGGKNPFLGICYIIVGALCFFSVAVFAILMKFKGRYVCLSMFGSEIWPKVVSLLSCIQPLLFFLKQTTWI
eukprot:m.29445 g.29445  ORF g.29445 m.29445 type:complete len:398 (+) comp6154_c0_seq2:39-1232(+)